MRFFGRYLTVAGQLYAVVGIMCFLIALEVFTLGFAMGRMPLTVIGLISSLQAALLAVGYVLVRGLVQRIREVTRLTIEAARGNFNQAVPSRSKDEISQMTDALLKMSRELRQSINLKVRAENANQVKTLFLAGISHEVRNPLGVMMGLVEILKDPQLPWAERKKYLETIENTGNNLTRILNDLLDISRVESGNLEIQKSAVELLPLISEIQLVTKLKAEQNRNELHFVRQGEIPKAVLTDRVRLRQILLHLIGNALKFTRDGSVTVTYGISRKNSTLYFQISDTGVGISSENQPLLFKSFFQMEDEPKGSEGTGLGLVLSKRLAQALGGDVELKSSVPGQGSVFMVNIKNEAVEEKINLEQSVPMADLASSDILTGKKVLVVEDVIDNQMLTKLYLARKGMKVQFANNGAEGVQRAMGDQFDVVLMDMQMPVMDGYTATRQLRNQGYRKPIIALTAHAMKEDRERCLQAGCNDYLTKPLDSNALYSSIAKNLAEDIEHHREEPEGSSSFPRSAPEVQSIH